MVLSELLEGVRFESGTKRCLENSIEDITCRSEEAGPGVLFVAIRGEKDDGHRYVNRAFEQGSPACVVDTASEWKFPESFPLVRVENTRLIFSLFSSRFFRHPSRDVKLIGITGTNGKTTTSFLVQHLFNQFSACGLIGTIRYQIGTQIFPSKNTTPSAYEINSMLAKMSQLKMRYCSMEVSSHALSQDRVAHLAFETAVFTNLTQDHLDYHRGMDQYFEAKKKLFLRDPAPNRCLINADDPYGRRLMEVMGPGPRTYGMKRRADYFAEDVRVGLGEIQFGVRVLGRKVPVRLKLACDYNVSNVLAAFACACEEGWDPERVAESLTTFPVVPGRMERVDCDLDFYVFVDYAHTPDAFCRVLGSVRSLASSRVITVFGCGGDRDRGKRPLMGHAASLYSDVVVITSDNPRSEDPDDIMDQIEAGVFRDKGRETIRIRNREEAIAHALSVARPGDVVLILGKGHESYQIVGSNEYKFDDREVVERLLSGGIRV